METIKYLCNAASLFQSNNILHHRIKSNLLQNAFVSCDYNNLKISPSTAGSHIRCQYCHTEWKHNKFSYKAINHKKLKRRIKQKYKSIEKNINGKYNEKEIKKVKERLYGKIILITCSICNKTTKHVNMKQKGYRKKLFDASLMSQSLNISSNSKTPNKLASKPQTNQHKPNKTSQLKRNNKKLQELCYQTSEEQSRSPGVKNIANKSQQNSPLNTPVLTTKKKKQRDKFAGLLREACIASSTPKQKSNLQMLLKEKM